MQIKAVDWARGGIWGLALGIGAISAATPFVSTRIFDKWFSWPEALYLAPLPIMSGLLVLALWALLQGMPMLSERWSWAPFAMATLLWTMAFGGLAYSFYPYVVPDRLTIYDAAIAPESLQIILYGVAVVLPTILACTVLAYVIFRDRASALRYD